MEVRPKNSTTKGPSEWFTGDVYIDAIVQGVEPSHIRVSAVHFTPGARTAWHSHELGQTLYVTEGKGLVQSRGGDVVSIRSGDIVSTPRGEWHWHGAAPDHFRLFGFQRGVPGERGHPEFGPWPRADLQLGSAVVPNACPHRIGMGPQQVE